MKAKIFMIMGLVLVTLLSIVLVSQASTYGNANYIEILFPADNHYWILDDNISFRANVSPYYNQILNISFLYTNISGTWTASQTVYNSSLLANTTELNFIQDVGGFTEAQVVDGMYFKWTILACDNSSNCTWADVNRTVNIRSPPTLTVTPATGRTSNTRTQTILVNATGRSTSYHCSLWTNRSGTNHSDGGWGMEKEHFFYNYSLNTTGPNSFVYDFDDGNVTLWAVKCKEADDLNIFTWTSNRTMTISTSQLTVVIDTPVSHYSTSNLTILNITATSPILYTCRYYNNGTLDNFTNASDMTSGVTYNLKNLSSTEGSYHEIIVSCDDTAGNEVNATHWFRMDSLPPQFQIVSNDTRTGSCDTWQIRINSSEKLNYSTIRYVVTGSGLPSASSASHTQTTSNSLDNSSLFRYHNISFGMNTELNYTVNVTLVDLAGNVNLSQFITPVPLSMCSGWSLYTMYNKMNMTSLASSMNYSIEYIYKWNSSGQNWIIYVNGSGSNGAENTSAGDALFFYNTGNFTWFRENNTVDYYLRDISNGTNFLGMMGGELGEVPHFSNITNHYLRNISGGNVTGESYEFHIEDFASYNNTGKKWVSAAYGYGWNNVTHVGKGANNSLDALWIWSNNYKIIYNSSVNYITGNWSAQ